MSEDVRVIVLRTAGTNCNKETAYAFAYFGAWVDQVHVNELIAKKRALSEYHILALPGGFSYGDDIASGKILANELRLRLGADIRRFIDDGKLIIGICNGFQVLVKAGILPGFAAPAERDGFQQEVTLTCNDSGRFEDRWVHLKPDGKCVWTKGIKNVIYLPVAHGEGKFVPRDYPVLEKLRHNGQVVFRYCTPEGKKADYPGNPNGSLDGVAGICDETGRVFGLMPHPERHFRGTQHPYWTRLKQSGGGLPMLGDGAKIFENGIRYVQEKLLRGEAVNV